MKVYDFHDYNDSGILKVPVSIWLLLIYSMRHALLLAGLSVTSFSHAIDLMGDFTDETHWLFFLCGLPGLLFFVIFINRTPKAGTAFRWAWQRGRGVLASALILHLVISISFVVKKPVWILSLSHLMLLVDFAWLVFLYRSERVKDVFADFPALADNSPSSKT